MYLGSFLESLFTPLFFIFLIAYFGYLVGGIKVKGVSLGTAGVLLVSLFFGIIANKIGAFSIGSVDISLVDSSIVSLYSFISNLGAAFFVTSVSLIAGPKFFRNFNKESIGYILMGVMLVIIEILITVVIKQTSGISISLASGLMTGAITSTPGLSAAKELAPDTDAVTAGYGIAYLFGVLGKVLFVQLVPKVLKIDYEEERRKVIALSEVKATTVNGNLKIIDKFGFFPFFFIVASGMIIGRITIPGINFSFGTSGGTLIMGLIVGHFGHLGNLNMQVDKQTLNFFRELGLIFFLIGAGVPSGINFMKYVKVSYFIYGAIITLIPMFIGYFAGRYLFKLPLFNNLGAITGGMTSTPALGTLIETAGTDDVVGAYAATYPVALVFVTLGCKLMILIF